MQKLSLKNVSALGLVLMGASALTAAIVPAKKDKVGDGNNNGRLLAFSASAGPQNVVSCVVASGVASCTVTAESLVASTTGRGLLDSFVGVGNNQQTVGNTSQTAAQSGDQQSAFQ